MMMWTVESFGMTFGNGIRLKQIEQVFAIMWNYFEWLSIHNGIVGKPWKLLGITAKSFGLNLDLERKPFEWVCWLKWNEILSQDVSKSIIMVPELWHTHLKLCYIKIDSIGYGIIQNVLYYVCGCNLNEKLVHNYGGIRQGDATRSLLFSQ